MDSLFAAVKQLSRQQKCEAALVVSTPSQITVRLTIPTNESVRTVLVLDDNPDVGELLQRMLTGCDYQVTHVRTASRAVKIARETQPSVILLDVVLPVLDGWEVLAVLLAEPLTSHIPVVVCSVLPDRELALSLGAADFLSKPIARPILSQTLARVLSSPIVGESVSVKH
jgi:CheY-like chemotaxis protein